MKLWLDDIRPAPSGWLHAHSVNEAIAAMQAHAVTHVSLDHDLGDYSGDDGEGTRLVLWMAEHDRWPSTGIRVHSANPPGMRRMLADIDRYGPFPVAYTHERGDWSGPL